MAHHERQAALITLHLVNNTLSLCPSYTRQLPTAHSLMSSCSSRDLVSDWVASLLSEGSGDKSNMSTTTAHSKVVEHIYLVVTFTC